MKIVLEINGREMTFSEEEIVAILEKHFSASITESEQKEAVEEVTEKQKEKISYEAAETAQKPTEGKWFEVNPEAINRKLFKIERKDESQERTRQIILEAFEKVKNNPERYNKPFKTLISEKKWKVETVIEQIKIENELGYGMADWVEQALEWAQRISNGESWKAICNDADTANWYRLVVWKNGYLRLVGGSCKDNDNYPISYINHGSNLSNYKFNYAVPLVVLYK